MNQIKPTRMLAIALDAAEPAFVRRLMQLGRMPCLARLRAEGKWFSVESNARLGSGSVWPTFITGHDAAAHGVYGEWVWCPETMGIIRYSGDGLTPFWQQLNEQGASIGILDVPFMPLINLRDGFEISEWGPHDVVHAVTEASPNDVAARIGKEIPIHPLQSPPAVTGPGDYQNLEKIAQTCLDGARLRGEVFRNLLTEKRPDLSMVAFPEVHRSSHYLWHTVEPDHHLYRNNGFGALRATKPDIADIYQEIDRQIGEMMATVGEDTPVMVFSLHGMRPTHGTPDFLTPLMCEWGYARMANWSDQGWGDRLKSLFGKAKRNLPGPVKKLYYQLTPATTTHRLARTTMLPLYDWSKTRAFSLPTDQNGWIRINLSGREASGIVPADEYEELCNELESKLKGLVTEDGKRLVSKTFRTAASVEQALGQRVPDIVVHWEEAAFTAGVGIQGSSIRTELVGEKYMGQHSYEGFCILRNAREVHPGDTLLAKDMGSLITRILEQGLESKKAAAQ